MTWHEVQRKLLEAQKELQMCIHKAELTELGLNECSAFLLPFVPSLLILYSLIHSESWCWSAIYSWNSEIACWYIILPPVDLSVTMGSFWCRCLHGYIWHRLGACYMVHLLQHNSLLACRWLAWQGGPCSYDVTRCVIKAHIPQLKTTAKQDLIDVFCHCCQLQLLKLLLLWC